MKKTRKGFTIVELIIVIAVIAVLTAILVPTFIHLTKKANEAADHSLVTNLNKALAMREAEEGDKGKNNTMYDCVMDLEKEGYKLPQLATRSDEDLVWSRLKNRFFLSKEHDDSKKAIEEYGEKYDCWHIYEKMPETQEWAIYPNEETWNKATATKTAAETEIVTGLEVGFDSGKAKISSVKYESGKKRHVVIRTDGGNLTVNASLATVDHYAVIQVVDIQAIYDDSYHEFGTVIEKLKVAGGHVVVEETGEVPNVEITSSSNPIKIDTNDDIVVSVSSSVEATSVDNVIINATGEIPEVVIDEKIPVNKVTVNGSTASESTVTRITKVSTFGELTSTVNAQTAGYIMFTKDIESTATPSASTLVNVKHNTTIDGNGFKLSGNGGTRSSNYDLMTINNSGTTMLNKVVLKNLYLEGASNVNRPVEYRGNIKETVLDNVHIKVTKPTGTNQGITIGGNQDSALKFTIKNSSISMNSGGYCFISFNPVDMEMEKCELSGYCAFYFKGPDSSHGSRGSNVVVKNSTFNCQNKHSGQSDDFGAIVFEEGFVNVTLIDTYIDASEEAASKQSAILFNQEWADYFENELKNGKVTIKGDSTVIGRIDNKGTGYDISNDISIEGGKFIYDPSDYLAAGKTVTKDDSFFVVK